jgi:hypothetical protein
MSASLSEAQPRHPSRQGCVVTQVALAGFEGDAVDPVIAPRLVFAGDAAVLAWRERSGALRARAFDAQWRPVGPARELARPAGAFTMVATPTGVAIAYVERGHDVVLARLNGRAEAQNVPRRVAREDAPLDSVALAVTDAGLVVAWSADEGRTLRASVLDPRGVAHEGAVELGAGRAPRLAWLASMGALALTVSALSPSEDATLLGLSTTLQVNTRLRWPASMLGPLELDGALHGVQVHGSGAPVLVRVPPGGAPVGLAGEGPSRARYALVDAAHDGASALVLISDAPSGRLLVARASPDGSLAPPALVRQGAPTPATIAVRGDGVAFVARREVAAHTLSRVAVAQARCER